MSRIMTSRLRELEARGIPCKVEDEGCDLRRMLWRKAWRQRQIWKRAAVLAVIPAVMLGALCVRMVGPQWAMALLVGSGMTLFTMMLIAQGWQYVELGEQKLRSWRN